MKRKILAIALSFILCVGSGTVAFATEGIAINNRSEQIANDIENITGVDGINQNIKQTKNSFLVKGENNDISIPKDVNNSICIKGSNSPDVEMTLPDEILDSEGVVTDGGTIVFNSESNASVSVQPLVENFDGNMFDGIRSVITIENEKAPREYTFGYKLEQGHKLISAKEYSGENTEEIYIVDSDNNIIAVIDSAWAKDNKGKDVKTYYQIEGNKLIQRVEFDENTAFPVIADPTVHKNKTCVKYLTKSEVRKVYNSLKSGSSGYNYVATILGLTGYGLVPAIIATAGSSYLDKLATKYNDKWGHMKKGQYLKVTTTFRYRNGGKNSGYVYSGETLKIVNKKGA